MLFIYKLFNMRVNTRGYYDKSIVQLNASILDHK